MKYAKQIAVILAVVLISSGSFAFTTLAQRLMAVGGGGGGGCTASTNFLARTSLTGSDVTNYQNLICGLVTDGVITGDLSGATGCGTHLDGLYIFATADSTTALKNLCGTGYTGTANNSPTFSAYNGFTGGDTTGTPSPYIDTGYSTSTAFGNLTLNAAHISVWNLSNVTPTNGFVDGGQAAAAFASLLEVSAIGADGNSYYRVNDLAGSAGAPSAKVGHFLANRTDSTHSQGYMNGTLVASPNATSVALVADDIYFLCRNLLSDQTGQSGTGHQIAIASWGGDLVTSSLALPFYNRLHTYMVATGH